MDLCGDLATAANVSISHFHTYISFLLSKLVCLLLLLSTEICIPLWTDLWDLPTTQLPVEKFKLMCVDSPDSSDPAMPRIYNIKIEGGQHAGNLNDSFAACLWIPVLRL